MPELLPIPRSTPERSIPPVSETRGGHLHRLTVLTPTVRTAVNVAIRSGYTFTTAGQVQAVTVCPAGDKTAVYARHNGVPSFLREPTHTQAKPGGAKRVCYFLRGSTQLLPRRHLGAHTAPITTLVVCSIYTGRQRVQQCLLTKRGGDTKCPRALRLPGSLPAHPEEARGGEEMRMTRTVNACFWFFNTITFVSVTAHLGALIVLSSWYYLRGKDIS